MQITGQRIHRVPQPSLTNGQGNFTAQVPPEKLPSETVALVNAGPPEPVASVSSETTPPIEISNGAEAVAKLGKPKLARKKSTISRRLPSQDVEMIETSWGPQEAKLGLDYVAIQKDGVEYPYKKDLFEQNMEPVPGKPGQFRKKTLSKLIEVPKGVEVDCITIDGGQQKPLRVKSPDFVCVGLDGEVYPLDRERFKEEFEWAGDVLSESKKQTEGFILA